MLLLSNNSIIKNMSNVDKICNFEKGFYKGVKELDKVNKDREFSYAKASEDKGKKKKKSSDLKTSEELKRERQIKNDTEGKGTVFNTIG